MLSRRERPTTIMRNIFYLIVLAAAAYLGYTYYLQKIANPAGVTEETAVVETAPPEPQKIAPATPAPRAFVSKIQIAPGAPNEKHLAPPGIFYMRERVSAETATGVHAVVPGEQVKLLQRNTDGTLRLSHDLVEFVVKETQVTNDLDAAQEAEHQDFLKRGGR